ncbi:MAG: GntR family transcriptional regulator [Flavobacteriaceae bacterium]
MKEDSLALKVYVEIRRKILSSQIAAGVRLKENDWAKKLDVNRMAVREALTRLLGEGLVESGKKGGYFVTTLTADDVMEIKELREILELGALKLAFQKIKQKDIELLELISEDFTIMVQKGYLEGACEADVKFHETLISCAYNKKLVDIYQLSNIPLFHQKLGKTQVKLTDYEETDIEHRKLVKAIKEKNFKLAKETLLKHLHRGAETVIEP